MQYDTEDVIKNCFGGAYTKDNPCVVIKISNKQISNNLKQYGLCGAKSTKEIPYILNNKELEKHYIRGIIDGDGYIRSTESGFGVVGSLNILQYIKNFIQNNITDVSNNNIKSHDKIYKFAIQSAGKTKLILDYLYKDATIYLDRKYKLYLEEYCIKN